MKIRPVGSELFHADRQPDITKLIFAVLNFATEPKTNKLADYGARHYMWRLMRRQIPRIVTLTHILVFW